MSEFLFEPDEPGGPSCSADHLELLISRAISEAAFRWLKEPVVRPVLAGQDEEKVPFSRGPEKELTFAVFLKRVRWKDGTSQRRCFVVHDGNSVDTVFTQLSGIELSLLKGPLSVVVRHRKNLLD